MRKNITGKYITTDVVDKFRPAFELMFKYNKISLNEILEKFREHWGLIAMGFEAFGADYNIETKSGVKERKAGAVAKMFKDDALHDRGVLKDVIYSVSYATMGIFKRWRGEKVQLPDGRWTEDVFEIAKMMEPLMETVSFVYTLFGDEFFEYVVERKARGLKPIKHKVMDILSRTSGDELLFKGLDMENKEAAMEEMIDGIKEEGAAKRQMEMSSKKSEEPLQANE